MICGKNVAGWVYNKHVYEKDNQIFNLMGLPNWSFFLYRILVIVLILKYRSLIHRSFSSCFPAWTHLSHPWGTRISEDEWSAWKKSHDSAADLSQWHRHLAFYRADGWSEQSIGRERECTQLRIWETVPRSFLDEACLIQAPRSLKCMRSSLAICRGFSANRRSLPAPRSLLIDLWLEESL